MSKRLCLLSAGLVAIVAAGAASIPACGGSSSDNGGTGGGGGVLMEAGTDTAADNASPPDTSIPETSAPDVSSEPDVTVLPDAEILEGSLFDMSIPDVTIGDSGATLQACYDCSVDKCSSELEACQGDDKCRTLVLCFFQDECFDSSAAMGINQACATGCIGKAGIQGMTDPALALGLSYAQCVNTNCASKCGMPDGGLQIDSGPDVLEDVVLPDASPPPDGG